MSTLAQIVLAVVWLVIVLEVAALFLSVIYMYRKDHEHVDTAADEREVLREGQRTLLERIERLRTQLETNEERVRNYIIFNHTRNAVIEDALGFVTKDGGVRITGAPLKIDPKYVSEEVRLLVILKNGEDAAGFLGG